MNWEDNLISLYFWVCDYYRAKGFAGTLRMSNNANNCVLAFTDEEAMTVFLYGLQRKYRDVKQIYQYAKDHLLSWFPQLPSYAKFNERLNFLNNVFRLMCQAICNHNQLPEWLLAAQKSIDATVDSMPIILAAGPRADSAKVARGLADKAKASSKGIWFYGLRLHVLGICRPSTIPYPKFIAFAKASQNDNTMFKEMIASSCSHLTVYGDKIYKDEGARPFIRKEYNCEVIAGIKRKRGQKHLRADHKITNTLISRIRQPIESFFNWINEATGIQNGSKVRSTKGLLKHLFARLAAALLLLI